MMKSILFAVALLAGCASTSELVHVGMPKSEVLSTLGKPMGLSRDGNVEVLRYPSHPNTFVKANEQDYLVVLRDGRVTEYGPDPASARRPPPSVGTLLVVPPPGR
jgi:hypothetical protein